MNVGIRVFITTHSDYLIRELNTLIMLNHDKPHLKRIARANGYQEDDLISSNQVRVYMAQEDLMPLEKDQKRRRRGHTLVPADIDPQLGIEASSFDKTIDQMNNILEDNRVGGGVESVNEIAILQKMLVSTAQIPLQPGSGRPSVKLTDKQAKTTVEIKGLPHDTVVIRAEDFRRSSCYLQRFKRANAGGLIL